MDAFNAQFSDPFNSNPQQPTPQPVPQQIPQATQMPEPNFWGNEMMNQSTIGGEQNTQQTIQQQNVPASDPFQPQFQENTTPVSFETPIETNKNTESVKSVSEEKKSNGWGVVSLILSIIGVVGVLFVVTAPIGIVLLILAFIFGLIGLFKKPRGKAITWFFISGLSLGAMAAFVYYVISLFYTPIMNLSERFTVEMKPRIEAMMLEENISKFTEDEFEAYLEAHIEDKIEAFAKKIEESQEIEGIGKFSEIKTKDDIKKVIDFGLNALMDTALEVVDEFATEKDISFDEIDQKQHLNGMITDEDDEGIDDEDDEIFDDEELDEEDFDEDGDINEENSEDEEGTNEDVDEEHGTDSDWEEEIFDEEEDFDLENDSESLED